MGTNFYGDEFSRDDISSNFPGSGTSFPNSDNDPFSQITISHIGIAVLVPLRGLFQIFPSTLLHNWTEKLDEQKNCT